MKIAFFETDNEDREHFEKTLGGENELFFNERPLTEDNCSVFHEAEVISIFVYSKVTSKVMDCFPNLKAIATMSTGYDHIDMEEAKKRGIAIMNVPTYGEITVAEHTFALILAVSRKIIESYHRVKDRFFSPEGLTGFDLQGKTLGVVGVGNIGRHVIKIAKGFDMNVIAYKRTPDEALAQELGFTFVSLDELLSRSDIVTLHIPYSSETHHLMNKDAFGKMKEGSVIINTSRGQIIDTTALLEAIESKKLKGAGLDVVEGEPLLKEEKELLSREFDKEELLSILKEHMLLNYPNVVLTPHNAFNSDEALARISKTTEDNIRSFISGNPQNVVS